MFAAREVEAVKIAELVFALILAAKEVEAFRIAAPILDEALLVFAFTALVMPEV